MTDYQFADPPPWDHQRRGFMETRDLNIHALFWEQRTGKSRVIMDTAAYNYELGRIDGLLVLAPSGVHINWGREAMPFIPAHVPTRATVWRTGRMATVAKKEELDALLKTKALACLFVSYDSLTTKPCKAYLAKFLRMRKLLIVADESDDLSRASSKRTIAAIAAARWGKMRRICTGTPNAETPFSLYTQTNFLRPGLLGFTSFVAYKCHYAQYEMQGDYVHREAKQRGALIAKQNGLEGEAVNAFAMNYAKGIGRSWMDVTKDADGKPNYLNLDELNARLSKFSTRVTRAMCGAQLPTFSTRSFELTTVQRDIYNDLERRFISELDAFDGTVTARMVIVRYVRLQQISSGFVPLDPDVKECPTCDGTDDDCSTCEGLGVIVPPGRIATLANPRMEALESELHATPGQTVIWTRFRFDADAVVAHLRSIGRRVGRYDGGCTSDAREADLVAFQAGKLDDMVASPQSCGRGRDLSLARTAIFYSHHWSLRLRLQAQDRIETLKRFDPVILVDLMAEDTVDGRIIDGHRTKRALQETVVGRRLFR